MRNIIGITCLFFVSVLWSQSGVLLDVYGYDGVDMFHRDVISDNTFKIGIMRKPFYDDIDTLSLQNVYAIWENNFLPLGGGIYSYDTPVGEKNQMGWFLWGLILGKKQFSLSYAEKYYFSGSHRRHHWQAGILSRFNRNLSWEISFCKGFVRDTLVEVDEDEPAIFGALSEEKYLRTGIAVRPYREYLTLWGDVIADGDFDYKDAVFGCEIMPARGIYLRGEYSLEKKYFRAGIRFDLGHTGVFASAGKSYDKDFSAGVILSEKRLPTILPYRAKRVKVTISGDYPESPKLFGGKSFRRLSDALYRVAQDSSVEELLIKLDSPSLTFAQYEEIRKILEKFKSRGGKIKIYAENLGNGTTYLVSLADRVCLPPAGGVQFFGIGAELTYYRGLFDKLGIRADMIHIGDYKTAAEPYYADSMSPQMREELTRILSHIDTLIVSAIASAKGISSDSVRKWMENSPMSPQDARKFGIITDVAYWDEFKDSVGWGEATSINTYLSETSPLSPRWDEPPKIAVIPVEGTIAHGASSPEGFLSGKVAGDKTVVKLLEKAAGDKSIKGIILRVDSPGGSAYASDLIWRAAVRAKEKKPLWVSMGSYAASGGYYISSAGDSIFADNSTITGSIGVVGGKFSIGGLYQKLGLSPQAIYLSPNANIYSLTDTFTTAQRELIRKYMEQSYSLFKERVLAGRKNLTPDSLESLAQGKAHTGTGAKLNGLVDEIAGLSEVERRMAHHLGLKEGEYQIYHCSPYEAFDWFEFVKKFAGVATGKLSPLSLKMPEFPDADFLWYLVPYYIELK